MANLDKNSSPQNPELSFKDKVVTSLKNRTSGIKATRWIRFSVVALLWIFFSFWTECPMLLIFLLLIFDIYITGYIPLTWWKHSERKWVRSVMAWVDAILYAVVLVYFVFCFVGQNYQIPSSSLEKTLLTGDYLFVNKLTYGPRVPMTPVHFPLVHNTLPILNCDSYLEWPRLKYKRLAGFRNVEIGDIVVFNFPAGDTVMTKMPNPDYYQLVRLFGYNKINGIGSENANAKIKYGEKITRPVDRRENYVKRCVGLPGQRLKLVNGEVWTDGVKQTLPADAQFNYFVATKGSAITEQEWDDLGVSLDDRMRGVDPYTNAPIYRVPLTADMHKTLSANPKVALIEREPADGDQLGIFPFELSEREGWTRSDYGGEAGILIPKKGMTVNLDYDNWLLYERAIRVYENNPTAKWHDGKVYIDGKPVDTYTFAMDYYFMMGDNRDNSLDSRYWGFVPEDHIVGTPMLVLISFDKDKSIFSGGIRWNRIFSDPNPDK